MNGPAPVFAAGAAAFPSMNILKILHKRRVEKESETPEFWNSGERFVNSPPELSKLGALDSGRLAGVAQPLPADPPAPETIDAEAAHRRQVVLRLAKCPVVPVDRAAVDSRAVAVNAPSGPACEQFRRIRAEFLNASRQRQIRSLVVVSHGPSEGKSIIALNLAWLLAQTEGLRVLLVDADLRRPRVGSYLAVAAGKGFDDVASGGAGLLDSVVRLEPSGLYLLAGGTPREDVADIVAGNRFGAIATEAAGLFDVVIFDAPPLGYFSETQILVDCVDGVILVARSNKTSTRDIAATAARLPRSKVICGVVSMASEPPDDAGYEGGLRL